MESKQVQSPNCRTGNVFIHVTLLFTSLLARWVRNCRLPVVGFIAHKTSSGETSLSMVRALFVLFIYLILLILAVGEKTVSAYIKPHKKMAS